jgi:hypothetical protein
MKTLTNEVGTKSRGWINGLGVSAVALGAALVVTGCNNSGSTPAANSTAANSAAESAAKTSDHGDAAHDAETHPHSTKIEFSAKSGAPTGGAEDVWTIKVLDAESGEPVKDFEIVHDKLMHLIVVKKDLSWFNHIHPKHEGNGVFTVATTLPSGGDFKLYADYTPKGGEQEVAPHELSVEGVSTAGPKLVADKATGAWLTKKVIAHPEGEPQAKGGATYEVALMPMPAKLEVGKDAMLHFQVRDAKGQPIKDLQPYLGAMGHAVILSEDTKSFLHSHPMAEGEEHDMSKMGDGKMDMSKMKESAPPKSGGPDVMFHTNFPTAGLYKAWGQFMHKGKLITAAFVVNVGAAKAGAPKDAAHDHDESEPHAH